MILNALIIFLEEKKNIDGGNETKGKERGNVHRLHLRSQLVMTGDAFTVMIIF